VNFDQRYAERTRRSAELFAEASKIVPGGAGSSADGEVRLEAVPAVHRGRRRLRITDVDGNSYVDYLLGLGPMILGHRHPVVTEAVTRAITEFGTCPGLPYERGRRLIIRFEGHYHGWQDTVYWSNHVDPVAAGPAESPRPVAAGPGVPLELADTLIVLTWNDPDSFRKVMGRARPRGRRRDHRGGRVQHRVHPAGARLPGAAAQRDPRPGRTADFRQVITGFRFCRGGAQEWFGVTPDLTTLAKGLGGGFPVAAIGGSAEVMGMIAEGRYSHSGTYNANAVACAAVSAAMDVLKERDAERYANELRFTRWYPEMFLRGVLFHPSQYENLFVSLVTTDEDIDATLAAADDSFKVLAAEAS
jgi:glutamate-1-semialdehyde 2,1-aminomutase